MGAEKTFENKVKKYIKDHGGWEVKFFANRMTKSGIPDILACVNGYFIGIEVKAEHGKPSKLQKHQREQIHLAGGYSIILYPQDYLLFQSFIDSLNGPGHGNPKILEKMINERSS